MTRDRPDPSDRSDAPAPPAAPPPHTLQDHQLGAGIDGFHNHGDDSDHDHDHDDMGGEPGAADHALWVQDNVILHSVGIDIGSAGTQVAFSKVHLQRVSDQLSTRYVVVSREPIYQSPSTLTPYQSDTVIDAHALSAIIDDAYAASGLHADDIDAGAVILTGEALRRENSRAIAEILAEQGGEFVCATAGHHMESMLAVYGSGAARRSFDHSTRILNVDIGGGTTKLGLVRNGEIEATAAVHLGGRLLVTDHHGRIIRLDPAGRAHALRAGFDWQPGSQTQPAELAQVAATMADALLRFLLQRPTATDCRELLLTDALPPFDTLEGVMFSGGVGEYVYCREPRDFGDLGKLFGETIRARLDAGVLPWTLLPAGECLRATVLGASEYSVQLSGNTTFVSDPARLLPRKNLQVVPLSLALPESIDAHDVTQAMQQSFTHHDLSEGDQDIAISLHWSGPPTYQRLAALADGLLGALPRTLEAGRAIYVVVDGDIAMTLGHLIKDDPRVKSEVLLIDGILLRGFNFIDLGRIRMPSRTVPVTIKSLVFSEDPRLHGAPDPGEWHAHDGGAPHRHANGHRDDHGHDAHGPDGHHGHHGHHAHHRHPGHSIGATVGRTHSHPHEED